MYKQDCEWKCLKKVLNKMYERLATHFKKFGDIA